MKAAYTPGPWEISHGTRVYAPGKAGPLLATIAHLPKAPGQEGANTRLIAAAPDLLAALQAFGSFHEWHPKYNTAIDMARAAIAKATGAPA